jgi:glycosyltransferase involved in cell wall biosynthesis
MKITQVISDTNLGGAGVLVSSVADLLKNDFDFEIIIPRASRLKERLPAGVSVKEFPMRPDESFYPTDVSGFYKYFKRNPTDVLHTHASLSSRIGGRMAGVKSCISTRHCANGNAKEKNKAILKSKLYNYCTDLTVSTADCVSSELRSEGVDPSKIVTIKNGSRSIIPISEDERAEELKALNLPISARIIGSCARLERVKGQDLILRIAPRLLSRFPDVFIMLVGDGSLLEEYRRKASFLGIGSRIIFTGYTTAPERYQRLFYINVNASRGTETSCLATSECMSLGIPTVASDFGGNNEMIKSGSNGLIFRRDNEFDLERALTLLLSSRALYKRLSAKAYESYLENYSAQKMADEYRKLYLSLLNKTV